MGYPPYPPPPPTPEGPGCYPPGGPPPPHHRHHHAGHPPPPYHDAYAERHAADYPRHRPPHAPGDGYGPRPPPPPTRVVRSAPPAGRAGAGSAGGGAAHQFRKGGRGVHSEPVVLRKKFSWRNYPELEEYLVSHRQEYLRHSALNYTAEQKHFNNRLTEGLLELAARLNYVFDESCFNFVAVRDRIRCYYKSYVQSSRKRGVVVGGFPKRARKEGGAGVIEGGV